MYSGLCRAKTWEEEGVSVVSIALLPWSTEPHVLLSKNRDDLSSLLGLVLFCSCFLNVVTMKYSGGG